MTATAPPPRQHGLLVAAVCAVAAAVVARQGGPLAAGGVTLAALAAALVRGRAGPWLVAVPAALGALTPPLPAPRLPRPGPVEVRGTVLAPVLRDRDGSTRLQVAPAGGDPRAAVTLWVDGAVATLPGDRLRAVGRLPAQPRRLRQGRAPQLRAAAEAVRCETGPPSWGRGVDATRLALQRSLLAAVPGDAGLLLTHLVLGRGPRLPPTIVDSHRATGLVHLLAVSGAHASILALLTGGVYALCTRRAPWTSRRYRRFCLLFLVGYGAVTGMEPPVLRAVVAFAVLLHAAARGRRATITAALAAPALVTALVAPADVLSPSFCLSYVAVYGLHLAGAFAARTWTQRWLRAPLVASLWATLLTAPLTLGLFGQLAPWTILATPLLAPLVSLLLGLGLATAVAGTVSPALAAVAGAPLGLATELYLAAVRGFALLPGAPILARSHPSTALLAGAALAALALWLWRPGRRAVAAGCLLLIALHFLPPPRPAPGLRLLDVGHGLACLVHTGDGRRVLVDCGALGDPNGAAHAAVDALRPARQLDLLVLTHGDHDHIGGVPALLQRVTVRAAALPAELVEAPVGRALRRAGARLLPVAALGHTLCLGRSVRIERPALPPPAASNDQGLVVTLDCGGFTALVPGDAEERGVDALLQQGSLAPVDVLVLPHHGRAHARLDALLRTTRPRLALSSCRPQPDGTAQAAACRARGVPVLETGTVGDVALLGAGDGGVLVETEFPARLVPQPPEPTVSRP